MDYRYLITIVSQNESVTVNCRRSRKIKLAVK